MSEAGTSRRWGRSVVAVLAGCIAGAVPAIVTDQVLHAAGVYPPSSVRMSDGLFVLATAYRLVFAVLGSYVIAWLAPEKPMQHALIGGLIGLVVSAAGAIATWNLDIGPHWYSLLLAITALPCSWLGGRLWKMRLQQHPAV
jgi:hypothetical protein